jgi:hypothetical protein
MNVCQSPLNFYICTMQNKWGRVLLPVQTGPGAHPASCTMRTGFFPGVKCGRGVLLTTHPLLVPRSWKSRAIPLPPLGHNLACNGVTLLYFTLLTMQNNLRLHRVKTPPTRASIPHRHVMLSIWLEVLLRMNTLRTGDANLRF